MKRFIKAYTSFTRAERMGLIALMSLLILLIIIRATMHFWVKPENDDGKSQQLAAAWTTFKNENASGSNSTVTKAGDTVRNATLEIEANKLFTFDPNTLDSAGFRKLGLPERTTAILLHWRAKGKIFYKKEDLKGLYTLKPETYEKLAPFIVIKGFGARNNYGDHYDENEKPLASVININTADSATLVRLKGIGPVKAHKIIVRREKEGPFTRLDQVQELCHFPGATFELLKPHLSLK